MQVKVVQIGDEGLELEHPLDMTWLQDVFADDLPTRFVPLSSPVASVRLQRIGLDVRIQANFVVLVNTECANCLSSIEMEIPVVFDLALQPAPERSASQSEEVELTPEDLNSAFLHGDSLDVSEILREQILLSLPMFPRCSDECRGLCPICGANRNEVDCGCEDADVDPRWSAIKGIKIS